MGREVDMEKEFSENIDRILAGQEVKVSADIDDDYRTALDLAQKLIRLRAVPSPSFKAQLKERLLLKLSEQETKAPAGAKKNWLWEGLRHLVPHKMVWRAVTTTALVLVLAAVGVVWYIGSFTQAPPPSPAPVPAPPPAPRPPPPVLQVSAVPAQVSYLPGERVEIEFSFTNTFSEPITVSPFPPEIRIMSSRRHEVVLLLSAGTRDLKLEPGETVPYRITLDKLDIGGQQVSPGWYYVAVRDVTVIKGTPPTTTHLGFVAIAKILVQFPQGAMEKSIEVNQSQTVNDITITLERVELSVTGARFYAFTIPPGYSPPEPLGPALPPPPPDMVPVHAEYTVDSVTKDAGWSGIGVQAEGLRLTWGSEVAPLDPVPSDAKELIFTITRFGDMEGPWEFFIPLEP